MTSVWYLNSGTIFDGYIFEALTGSGVDLQQIAQSNFENRFRSYLSCDRATQLTIVLDVGCISTIYSLVKVVKRCRTCANLAALRVIILSDFSSWGGKAYTKSIGNFVTEFKTRSPLACAQEIYSLENLVAELVPRYGTSVCIVGYGVFYGRAGMDMQDIFRSLWGGADPVGRDGHLGLFCEAETVVPVTRIDNFVRDVVDLALREGTIPSFVASIDRPPFGTAPVPLYCQLVQLHSVLNGPTRETPFLAATGDTEGTVQSSALWRCNLPVEPAPLDAAPLRGLQSHFEEVWAEFLAASRLAPVTALVAGPPRSGKTDFAAKFAERLQVELVTVESAVKFVFNLDEEVSEDLEVSTTLKNSVLLVTKAEVRAAAEAKANEGKKPAKGAVAPPDGLHLDDTCITSSFCQSLPLELQRKCLSAQALLHPRCRRRGFVLDVWDAKLVADRSSLLDALHSVRGEDGSDAPLTSVDLVVELHCRPNLPVERLVTSQGAQAKAKDSQAAVKALEGLLVTYSAQLIPIANDEAGDGATEHMKMGHKGAAEIFEQGASVCRVNLHSDPEPSPTWTEPLNQACTLLLSLRGGRIGWLPDLLGGTEHSDKEVAAVGAESFASTPTDLQNPAYGAAEPVCDVSAQIQQLDAAKLKALTLKANTLQAFLSSAVLPQLAEGLVRIQREQPADPIMFLAEQLARCSADRNQLAQDKARSRFAELLRQGGM